MEIKSVFLLVSTLLFMSACREAATPIANGVNAVPQVTSTSNTQASIPTLTATITPTLITTSTWTPLPTLISNEADMVYESWLKGTSTCSFPCWAGIVPGETSWTEAIHMLDPVLELHVAENLANCRFAPCRYMSWQYELDGNLYDGNLFSKDDIVYAISLNGDAPPEYTLRENFVKYGQLTQALVYTNPYTYAGEPPQLDLVIWYEKFNFAVNYIWQANTDGENIVACGSPSGFILGIVAIDKSQWTKLEIVYAGAQLDNGIYNENGFRTIDDVLDVDVDAFYQKVLAENDSSFCIKTPVKYWE